MSVQMASQLKRWPEKSDPELRMSKCRSIRRLARISIARYSPFASMWSVSGITAAEITESARSWACRCLSCVGVSGSAMKLLWNVRIETSRKGRPSWLTVPGGRSGRYRALV